MHYNNEGCYYSEPVNYYPGMYVGYYPYRYDTINNQPVMPESNVNSGNSGTGLSARNQFPGIVTDIKVENVVGEVLVNLGCNHLAAAIITSTSIRNLRLRVGSKVSVVVKATDVMIMRAS